VNDLLDNPAIQAGVAPFLVALAVAWPLSRTRFLGLASGAAFATAVALTIGFSFTASTSIQKLVLVEMLLIGLIVPIELSAARFPPARLRIVLALAGAAGFSVVWVALRVLQQQAMPTAMLAGAGAALYVGALAYSGSAAVDDAVPASASALVLALGSGALALSGASALLAQLGIGTAAGAGAALLVQALARRAAPAGPALALPAHVAAGLVGTLAVATGSLAWYCLLPTLAVPWCARIGTMQGRPVWLRGLVATAMASLPMLLAVLVSSSTAGAAGV